MRRVLCLLISAAQFFRKLLKYVLLESRPLVTEVTEVSGISLTTLQVSGKTPSHCLLFLRPPHSHLLVLLETHEASVLPGS